jgi:prepilin-type N-terminal cleavage/methylation domain-containing protein
MYLRNTHRGFTVVELMMSLAVLTVGISGIIAMQKVTAMSNLHSKSVSVATQIANAWQDQLLTDGSLWKLQTGLAPTTWLNRVTGQANTWFRPAYDQSRRFGAAFDALGNPVSDSAIAQAQFCVHLQLAPVIALGPNDPGNATIRATIRVLWLRVQGTPTGGTSFCAPGANVTDVGSDTANYHSLYQTLAIRIHP